MSLRSTLDALKAVAVPSAIPAANVQIWWPEMVDAYPFVVLSPVRATRERRVAVQRKVETHWVALEFLQDPRVAGGRQAAQQQVHDWIETAKANVRANRTLVVAGVRQCTVAGEEMESSVDLVALDTSVGGVVVRGYLAVQVIDLEVSG